MKTKLNELLVKLQIIAPTFLRVGISLVILWFGFQQIIDMPSWLAYLPEWTLNLPISQANLVYLNGTFEIIFGACMFLGFYTRIAALLVALHMLEIMYTVGYDAIGVRDFGITVAAFSVFMNGPDKYTLDKKFESESKQFSA